MSLWCYAVLGFVLFKIVSLSDAIDLDRNEINNVATTNQTTEISNFGAATTSVTRTIDEVITMPNADATTEAATTPNETTQIFTVGLKTLLKNQVITCDGYILNVFRLNNKKTKNPPQKYPVLLFHGMMQSSEKFTENKHKSVAFILEDLGFDVWLGNSRGNKYGRLHLYLEPDVDGEKYRFFNYSYEEVGLYDVAATVDYILAETGAEKVHYVGLSQGATAFLALNSLQPHYNDKFESAHLLAPLGYQSHYSNSKIQALSQTSGEVYDKLLSSGVLEIFPYNTTPPSPYTSASDCLGDKKYEDVCNNLDIAEIMGLDQTKFDNFDTRGGSLKQFAHYAQNIRDKSFRRWDYGVEKNKLIYGSNEPPKYDLKLVRANTVLYYSLNDDFVDGRDVHAMVRDMPNARAEEVARRTFTHLDFSRGNDLIPCVYRKIISDMGMRNGDIVSRGLEDYEDKEEEEDDEPDSSTKLGLSLVLYALPLLTLKLT